MSACDARPEDGALAKPVVEVYRNQPRRLLTIEIENVAGKDAEVGMVRATESHPFYVRDRGWTPANQLSPGDRLLGHDGRWRAVVRTTLGEQPEPVFNLQVADHHTYFVGTGAADASALVHNVCDFSEMPAYGPTNPQMYPMAKGGVLGGPVPGIWNGPVETGGHITWPAGGSTIGGTITISGPSVQGMPPACAEGGGYEPSEEYWEQLEGDAGYDDYTRIRLGPEYLWKPYKFPGYDYDSEPILDGVFDSLMSQSGPALDFATGNMIGGVIAIGGIGVSGMEIGAGLATAGKAWWGLAGKYGPEIYIIGTFLGGALGDPASPIDSIASGLGGVGKVLWDEYVPGMIDWWNNSKFRVERCVQ
jgi:hypothetical protein